MDENALTIKDDMSLTDLGTILVKSGFFKDTASISQALVKVLAGRELGVRPIAAMRGVNIIKGQVSLSAGLIASLIKKSKHYNYRVIEHTVLACELAFYELSPATNGYTEIGRSRFTMDDAKRAGLDAGDNWRKFPKNMLFARAISNGARWYCPDIFEGAIYTPDELDPSGASESPADDVINANYVEAPEIVPQGRVTKNPLDENIPPQPEEPPVTIPDEDPAPLVTVEPNPVSNMPERMSPGELPIERAELGLPPAPKMTTRQAIEQLGFEPPAEQHEILPNGPLSAAPTTPPTLEQARGIVSKTDGKKYGDMTTQELSVRFNSLAKVTRNEKGKYSPTEIAHAKWRMEAIDLILRSQQVKDRLGIAA